MLSRQYAYIGASVIPSVGLRERGQYRKAELEQGAQDASQPLRPSPGTSPRAILFFEGHRHP